MCKECLDAVEKYFPDCPIGEIGNFLIEATPFPFGDGEHVAASLKTAKDAGCTTWLEAMDYAERQLDLEMEKYHAKEENQGKGKP